MKRSIVFATAMILLAGLVRSDNAVPDERKFWSSISEATKHGYVSGVIDGTRRAVLVLHKNIGPLEKQGDKQDPRLLNLATELTADPLEALTVTHDLGKIVEVMTDLYKNPANSYIAPSDMVFIANGVLSGQDVGGKLQAARKDALLRHELNQRLRK